MDLGRRPGGTEGVKNKKLLPLYGARVNSRGSTRFTLCRVSLRPVTGSAVHLICTDEACFVPPFRFTLAGGFQCLPPGQALSHRPVFPVGARTFTRPGQRGMDGIICLNRRMSSRGVVMEIRPATPKDSLILSALCRDVQSLHAEHHPRVFKMPQSDDFAVEFFDEMLASPEFTAFIAEEDGPSFRVHPVQNGRPAGERFYLSHTLSAHRSNLCPPRCSAERHWHSPVEDKPKTMPGNWGWGNCSSIRGISTWRHTPASKNLALRSLTIVSGRLSENKNSLKGSSSCGRNRTRTYDLCDVNAML